MAGCIVFSSAILAASAIAQEGQFVGSYHRTDGPGGDLLGLRYDVGTRGAMAWGMESRFRMALHFQERPGEPNTELLRGRFSGELTKSALRLHAQLAPWQAAGTGTSPPREHDVELGLDFRPRNAPRVALDARSLERDLPNGRSRSEDRRALVSYSLGALGGEMAYRRLESTPPTSLSSASATEEWRGALHLSGRVRSFASRLSYDALVSDFESRERRRDFASQGIDWSGSWAPHARLSLDASTLRRWGRSDDNALPAARKIDERSVAGGVHVRPAAGLDLGVLREYRRRNAAEGAVDTDRLELDSSYRRAVRSGLLFQTGYRHAVSIAAGPGDLPRSTAYALVDGRLRERIDGRAEVRAAWSDLEAEGTLWRQVAQVRTRPTRTTRLDVTWSRDTLPIATIPRAADASSEGDSAKAAADTLPAIRGVTQRDRRWELAWGYDPRPGATLVASALRLDGSGRVERRERLWSLTTTARLARRASISGNISARWNRSGFERVVESGAGGDPLTERVELTTTERVRGIDLTGWLPGDYRVQTTWRRISRGGIPPSATYGITVSKTF